MPLLDQRRHRGVPEAVMEPVLAKVRELIPGFDRCKRMAKRNLVAAIMRGLRDAADPTGRGRDQTALSVRLSTRDKKTHRDLHLGPTGQNRCGYTIVRAVVEAFVVAGWCRVSRGYYDRSGREPSRSRVTRLYPTQRFVDLWPPMTAGDDPGDHRSLVEVRGDGPGADAAEVACLAAEVRARNAFLRQHRIEVELPDYGGPQPSWPGASGPGLPAGRPGGLPPSYLPATPLTALGAGRPGLSEPCGGPRGPYTVENVWETPENKLLTVGSLALATAPFAVATDQPARVRVERNGEAAATGRPARVRVRLRLRYRRVFCRGDLDHGGRWYTRVQRLPLAERLLLRIDGCEVAEADYVALHPSLACERSGLRPPRDPYRVYGDERDIVVRPVAKCALLVLINARDPRDVVRAVRRDINRHARSRGLTVRQLEATIGELLEAFVERVRRMHAPIADWFGRDAGVELQNVDAEIAGQVMLRCEEEGFLAICIHDSFICRADRVDRLAEIMREEYRAVVGGEIGIKVSRRPK